MNPAVENAGSVASSSITFPTCRPRPGVHCSRIFVAPDKPRSDEVLVTGPFAKAGRTIWSRFEGQCRRFGLFHRMVHDGRLSKRATAGRRSCRLQRRHCCAHSGGGAGSRRESERALGAIHVEKARCPP